MKKLEIFWQFLPQKSTTVPKVFGNPWWDSAFFVRTLEQWRTDGKAKRKHCTYIRWQLRTCCALMKENMSFMKKKKSDLRLLSSLSNVLNRSNGRDLSVRAHLFLRYHLIDIGTVKEMCLGSSWIGHWKLHKSQYTHITHKLLINVLINYSWRGHWREVLLKHLVAGHMISVLEATLLIWILQGIRVHQYRFFALQILVDDMRKATNNSSLKCQCHIFNFYLF